MFQVALERVVGGGDAPVSDDVGLHGGKMALPGDVGGGADFKIGEVGFAGEREQGDFAFLNAAFQIVHDERGLFHVLDIKLGLRAGDFEAQMEPDAFRNVDRAGEARAVEDLPVTAGVEDGRVLHGVGEAGFVLAEIDFLVVGFFWIDANVEAEKAADGRGGDVDVNDGVAHFEIFEHGRAAVE